MTTVPLPRSLSATDADQFVTLHDITWTEYEILLAIRGDRPAPRMTYLQGELELMSPSRSHEWVKTTLARLIEAWATERRVPLAGFGAWTLKSAPAERGLEPDECYALSERHDRPDLAVEVVWTRPAIPKLEVYRGLGVPEVWVWEEGGIHVHVLRGDAYAEVPRSELVPEAPLDQFVRFLDGGDQAQAVFGFLDWLRAQD
jgi:Uma2 family endonuclease